jgi:hypothetical protein
VPSRPRSLSNSVTRTLKVPKSTPAAIATTPSLQSLFQLPFCAHQRNAFHEISRKGFIRSHTSEIAKKRTKKPLFRYVYSTGQHIG